MTRKELIQTVVGMGVDDAIKLVESNGLKAEAHVHDTIIISIARPNSILLWVENFIVKSAELGDPCEIEDMMVENLPSWTPKIVNDM